MKAEDLRVGNYLSYHNQNVQVMALDKKMAEFGYFSDSIGFIRSFDNNDFPKPIPLTEDWLVKLGFEFDEEFMGSVLEMDCGVSFGIGEDGVMYYLGNIEPFWVDVLTEIKYLHEFQNLVHALTQTELTLKESEATH